jgi:hypothetical protein
LLALRYRFELYSFGIKILLRELKLRKVEDKLAKSEVRRHHPQAFPAAVCQHDTLRLLLTLSTNLPAQRRCSHDFDWSAQEQCPETLCSLPQTLSPLPH